MAAVRSDPQLSSTGTEFGVTWLVTGGAGYIGSHVVRALLRAGHAVTVLDDLSTGRPDRVPAPAVLVEGDVTSPDDVRRALRQSAADPVRGVVQLAARILADESVREPAAYYRVNVEGTRCVLDAALEVGVRRMVYTSSAAVYGRQPTGVVSETAVPDPLTPYGRSKLAGEWMVCDAAVAGLGSVSLRLFNVAGTATPELGPAARTGLLPATMNALYAGEQPVVFGTDYDTPDGSCVRDYVHVADVAEAFRAAVHALERADESGASAAHVFNVGRSAGTSVLEVLRLAAERTGLAVQPRLEGRRTGDAPFVVADTTRIRDTLGWTARLGPGEMISGEWAARQGRRLD